MCPYVWYGRFRWFSFTSTARAVPVDWAGWQSLSVTWAECEMEGDGVPHHKLLASATSVRAHSMQSVRGGLCRTNASNAVCSLHWCKRKHIVAHDLTPLLGFVQFWMQCICYCAHCASVMFCTRDVQESSAISLFLRLASLKQVWFIPLRTVCFCMLLNTTILHWLQKNETKKIIPRDPECGLIVAKYMHCIHFQFDGIHNFHFKWMVLKLVWNHVSKSDCQTQRPHNVWYCK